MFGTLPNVHVQILMSLVRKLKKTKILHNKIIANNSVLKNHAVEPQPKTNHLRIVCMSAPVCVLGTIGYELLRLSRHIQKWGRDLTSKVKPVWVNVAELRPRTYLRLLCDFTCGIYVNRWKLWHCTDITDQWMMMIFIRTCWILQQLESHYRLVRLEVISNCYPMNEQSLKTSSFEFE